MKRIKLFTFMLLVCSSLLFAACGPKSSDVLEEGSVSDALEEAETEEQDESQEETDSEDASIEFQPEVNGTVRIAYTLAAETLDPAKTGGGISRRIISYIGCSLTYLDAEGKVVPYVAESWTVSEDGLTYTFNLREDVKFHNGDQVTAHDFVWEFQRIMDPETASPVAGDLIDVVSIEALDDFTLQIVLSQPNFPFIYSLSDSGFMMPVSQSIFEEMGEVEFSRAPVGCGPMRFNEWRTGEKIVLERNPDFNWGPEGAWINTGPWYIEYIEFLVLPEQATSLAALEAGQIDVMNFPHIEKKRLEQVDILNIEATPTQGILPYVAFNVSVSPFDDVNVRKAFNLALDRQKICDVILDGMGNLQYGPLSPSVIGYWPGVEEIGYGYDPEAGENFMEGAGYDKDEEGYWAKDGERLSFTLMSISADDWVKTAQIIQSQLKDFGVEIDIQAEEGASLWPIIESGEHQLALWGWTDNEADMLWSMFHSSNVAVSNIAFVQDPGLDQLLDLTRTTVNEEERLSVVYEVQQYIIEKAYILPLVNIDQFLAFNKRIKGYHFTNLEEYGLDSAYIEK